MDVNLIVILAALFIALVMTFAQIKLFSIDNTLKELLVELRRERAPNPLESIDIRKVENPTSMFKL